MPEMYFHVRWPDSETQRCYSPSTVIEDYLTTGAVYELGDFVARTRKKYGVACTGVSDQLALIEETAAAYVSLDGVTVTVEGLRDADVSGR